MTSPGPMVSLPYRGVWLCNTWLDANTERWRIVTPDGRVASQNRHSFAAAQRWVRRNLAQLDPR